MTRKLLRKLCCAFGWQQSKVKVNKKKTDFIAPYYFLMLNDNFNKFKKIISLAILQNFTRNTKI